MKNVISFLMYSASAFVIAFVLLVPFLNAGMVNAQTGYERPPDITLKNPLTAVGSEGNVGDISKLVGLIIKALMGFVGSIVLLFFIMGGFTWLTSQGNPEKVAQGTKTMAYAALGALVVFLSYMLTNLVIKIISGSA